jgi:hypothetical protein
MIYYVLGKVALRLEELEYNRNERRSMNSMEIRSRRIFAGLLTKEMEEVIGSLIGLFCGRK